MNTLSFIQFDIVEFYPNITEVLLKKALDYAKNHINIAPGEIKIILQTKKAFLFADGKPWVKKGNKSFDVTMGSWDGAEVADLVGLYLLSQLSDLNLIIGLYRDDGLAVCNLSPRQAELLKKKLCRIFKENGLNITAEANLKSVNFLDINLNLETGIFRPYMKPNDTPTYVHKNSNHPEGILKNIPLSVNKRLSSISSNEQVFDLARPPYQEALQKSGYDFNLKFEPQTRTDKKKPSRQRKITWFNPPFSKNIQTNIGEKFLKLVDRNFTPNHPLRKIINRNTVKISYRCMPNMKQKISNHNFKVQKEEEERQTHYGCNCTGEMGPCPLGGNCLVNSVVYKAEVNDNTNTYTGLTCNTFKERFYGHRHSFRNRDSNKSTTLSSHIWNLKDKNENFEVKWSIIDRASAFNPVTRKCRLCLKEKYYIIFQPEGASLNERSELYSTCRHRRKQLLTNLE